MKSMNAIVIESYGKPDSLELTQTQRPELTDDTVLVRVLAATVNPLDWHNLTGEPFVMRLQAGLRRPASPMILGVDFAGRVEAVGNNVVRFKPGDEVFGGSRGSFAEFVAVSEHEIAHKPANLSFAAAAALPVAGLAALQGLRDHGGLRAGQTVLINGASGGVGTFAIQIAKSLGATVTGVCRTQNIDRTRSLGADRVIDYTNENFADDKAHYDVVLDNVGNRSLADCRRVLKSEGVYVLTSGPKNRWFGPIGRFVKALLTFAISRQTAKPFFAQILADDLVTLAELAEREVIVPVIDRHYPLGDVSKALQYLEQGHAKGKVVIDIALDSRAESPPPRGAAP